MPENNEFWPHALKLSREVRTPAVAKYRSRFIEIAFGRPMNNDDVSV
jgi:hypothetical protein